MAADVARLRRIGGRGPKNRPPSKLAPGIRASSDRPQLEGGLEYGLSPPVLVQKRKVVFVGLADRELCGLKGFYKR